MYKNKHASMLDTSLFTAKAFSINSSQSIYPVSLEFTIK